MSDRATAFLFAAGRGLLALLFLLAALNKILNYQMTLDAMQAVGLKPASLLLPLTIALEAGGGLLLIWGRFGAWHAGVTLAAFTLATNVYFHDFWTMAGEERAVELSLFVKNIAIAGGLLAVAGALRRGVIR
jgi:putative oxidoreductase